MSEPQAPLPDGTFDAFVVDAERVPSGALELSLTVVAGPHKGEVVDLADGDLAGDPLDLLGLPATLTVTDGRPSVRIDR